MTRSVLLGAVLTALALDAAPVPFPLTGANAPVDRGGLRLRIRSHTGGVAILDWDRRSMPGWTIDVTLENRNSTPFLCGRQYANGNRIAGCRNIQYVAWFPDGGATTHFFLDYQWDGPRMPLLIPARGTLRDPLHFNSSFCGANRLNDDRFDGDRRSGKELFRDNKGRFCLTALLYVDGFYLKSNTLRFNGCPAPPKTYDAFEHSPYTPQGRLAADVRAEKIAREGREYVRRAHERWRQIQAENGNPNWRP